MKKITASLVLTIMLGAASAPTPTSTLVAQTAQQPQKQVEKERERREVIINYYTIDRFEGNVAVLEDSGTLETRDVPRSLLPVEAKEGDVLTVNGGGEWRIDGDETAARAARVRGRFERLSPNPPPRPRP